MEMAVFYLKERHPLPKLHSTKFQVSITKDDLSAFPTRLLKRSSIPLRNGNRRKHLPRKEISPLQETASESEIVPYKTLSLFDTH